MRLHFRNHYSSHIWVAIEFFSPDACASYGSWETRGWWGLDPGAEVYVLNTDNRYAAYYAEASDGRIWTGPYGPVYVHEAAFDHCVGIGDNSPETRIVNMRLVDMGDNDDYYVNLIS